MSLTSRSILRQGAVLLVITVISVREAKAVGVLYADPGWYHAYDGNSAYYYDPDGYNTDYNNGSATNQPGGRGNMPALINPGPCADDNACAAAAIWQNNSSQWDGSAPGAPLGGTPNPPWDPSKPVLPPAAPGGVATYTESGTSYLRIQDPGDPLTYGWLEKGNQVGPGKPLQEGSNKKIEFKHEMARDPLFSDREDILDFGVTLSFRARIATAAHGPLDSAFPEDGSGPTPWPTDGLGYRLSGNGRAMVFVQQTSPIYGPSRVGFGLLNTNAITSSGVPTSTTGLVMNNKAVGPGNPGQVDTNTTDATRLNIVQLSNAQLQDWHEFWITIKALPSPDAGGNTHEVRVYRDGSLTPEIFPLVLGLQNEAGTGSFLDIGLTGGTQAGAFDLDFVAYKEGVVPPTLPGLPGDFNSDGKVNAGDYVMWRKNNGTNNALANDNGLGTPIGPAHYNLWRANFGNPPGAGSGFGLTAVPEPSSVTLFVLSVALVGIRRQLPT